MVEQFVYCTSCPIGATDARRCFCAMIAKVRILCNYLNILPSVFIETLRKVILIKHQPRLLRLFVTI